MKKVIMTVDVEGHDGSDPVTHLIMGKTVDGTSYGIGKLMDIFDYHHIKGLFFCRYCRSVGLWRSRNCYCTSIYKGKRA